MSSSRGAMLARSGVLHACRPACRPSAARGVGLSGRLAKSCVQNGYCPSPRFDPHRALGSVFPWALRTRLC